MARRLPVYFLIDISESMVGEPIQHVEEGIAMIINELKNDPNALETAWVSIIVFAGLAKTLVPLREISDFNLPKFPIGSGTSLSKGLEYLMHEMRKNLIKTTADTKGDWKPIVFLFTDGVPTDDTRNAIADWKSTWQRTANMVAISFGSDVNPKILNELTENVLLFKNTDSAAYKKFFMWITDSIKTSSVRVENNESGFQLAALNSDTLTKIDLSKSSAFREDVDSNFVVIAAKCQNTKRAYLIKYQKNITPSSISGVDILNYKLIGAFPVNNTYFEFSEPSNKPQTINTVELIGVPSCPCCGNKIALAMCQCGNIHCIGEEEQNTCPWCGNTGLYKPGPSDGFDVNRSQG